MRVHQVVIREDSRLQFRIVACSGTLNTPTGGRSWALVKPAGVAASITNARSGKESEEEARTGPPTVSLPTCRPLTAMGVRLDLRLVEEPLDRLEALHGFVA